MYGHGCSQPAWYWLVVATIWIAAGMVLAGCSDDLDENGGGGVIDGATGYVKIALSLPTDGMSTRSENDKFDDGLPDEYKVNSGIIAYFSGSESGSDENATFVKAYTLGDLSNWTPDGTSTDQITTRKVLVQEAPAVTEGNQLYALVILNPNSVVSTTDGGLTIGSTSLTAGTSKLSAVRKFLTEQTVDSYTKSGSDASFLMTNAPLAASVDSKVTARTLVPVTVYATEAAAEGAESSDQIYVERAVGKVTLSGFDYKDSKYTIAVDDESSIYDGDVIELEGWTLNITNKSTAVVRDVTGYGTWAGYTKDNETYFFGNFSNNVLESTYSRIYWAVDNNYDSEDTDTGFNTYNKENETTITWNEDTEDKSLDESYPIYCLENTIDATQAAKENPNMTYVLLKTKYHFDATAEENANFFIIPNAPAQGTLSEDDFESYVNNQMGYEEGNKVSVSTDATGGIIDEVSEVETLFGLTGEGATEKATAILAKVGTMKFYKNGTTFYYASYIKHFGDTYTYDPQNPNVTSKDDSKCLGYYGVVRNNWYELKITGISGPGEPEITPPSNNYGYINVSINILSWAKRTQDVEL